MKADERTQKISKKSSIHGFTAASILLVVLIWYEFTNSGVLDSYLLITLGASQAVFWMSYIYYRISGKNGE
jgi:uncharacterized membrane protein